ncbi:MAG TPA: hypothetical protein VGK22_21725 [Candidatus Angelobacter sp.]|jgi:hypothetical protein
MAGSKRIKKPYQRVVRFPEARGKLIAEVQLSLASDYVTVDIRFQDKTVLTFDLESSVRITPELLDWKSGNYKILKRWRTVSS